MEHLRNRVGPAGRRLRRANDGLPETFVVLREAGEPVPVAQSTMFTRIWPPSGTSLSCSATSSQYAMSSAIGMGRRDTLDRSLPCVVNGGGTRLRPWTSASEAISASPGPAAPRADGRHRSRCRGSTAPACPEDAEPPVVDDEHACLERQRPQERAGGHLQQQERLLTGTAIPRDHLDPLTRSGDGLLDDRPRRVVNVP